MSARYLVFTDLDGTLLEEGTGSFKEALPALARLKAGDHPLVFCTSKTFSECRVFQRRMGVAGPLIVENGGGIYMPEVHSPPESGAVGGWKRIPLGVPYGKLRGHLVQVREETGIDLVGLGDAGAAILIGRCGLTWEEAELALQREFDEPFLVQDNDPAAADRVAHAFRARGLQVVRGGQFFHLSGGTDKGKAVRTLSHLLREEDRFETAALGDSPNDASMLAAVDHPYLVMRPDGRHDPEVLRMAGPGLRPIQGEGPIGWNRAVLDLLARGSPGP